MVEYTWPERGNTSVLGVSHSKIDGPAKCTGTAKYSYDINPDEDAVGPRARLPAGALQGQVDRHQRRRKGAGRGRRASDQEAGRRNPMAG